MLPSCLALIKNISAINKSKYKNKSYLANVGVNYRYEK